MRAPRFAEPPHQHIVRGVEKDEDRAQVSHSLEPLEDLRQLVEQLLAGVAVEAPAPVLEAAQAFLLALGERPVLLGHPARIVPELRERALDILAEKHPDARQARSMTEPAPPAQTSGLWAKLADFGVGQVLSAEALAGVTKSGFTESVIISSSSSQVSM